MDLSLIYDNFISNSEKAGASIMLIELINFSSDSLSVVISDDGKGVDQETASVPDKMFESGMTTTDGWGIGLFSVKENLKKMNGQARFVGNAQRLKGATFEITFQ